MDAETARIVVIVGIAVSLGTWLLSTFIWRVTGTWERVLSDDERAEGAKRD